MIERTFDYRRIHRLAQEVPIISNRLYFLIEMEKDKDIGLWTLHRCEGGLRIHADMGVDCRGKKAIASARSAFNWVFKNTNYDIIYAGIPVKEKAACQIASRAGMNFKRFFNGEKVYEVKKWAA